MMIDKNQKDVLEFSVSTLALSREEIARLVPLLKEYLDAENYNSVKIEIGEAVIAIDDAINSAISVSPEIENQYKRRREVFGWGF